MLLGFSEAVQSRDALWEHSVLVTSLEYEHVNQHSTVERGLAIGTLIGAVFAVLLFMITVLSIPMLLDRELDFVTAMISSYAYVAANRSVMLGWGAPIALITFLAMIPWFLGLLVVLPLSGHASWHLYRQITEDPDATAAS